MIRDMNSIAYPKPDSNRHARRRGISNSVEPFEVQSFVVKWLTATKHEKIGTV
jgi:hypothetical protein